MQVSTTIWTRLVADTGVCTLHLYLVSDHLHLPGGTTFSFAVVVTWGAQLLAARAWESPGVIHAMTPFVDVC